MFRQPNKFTCLCLHNEDHVSMTGPPALQELQHLDLRCPHLKRELSRIPVIRPPDKPPAQHTPIALLLKVSLYGPRVYCCHVA